VDIGAAYEAESIWIDADAGLYLKARQQCGTCIVGRVRDRFLGTEQPAENFELGKLVIR
jgi:hypothetical protein